MKKLFIILSVSALLLSACNTAGGSEKERFISATVEVTCMIFESGDLLDPALEDRTKAVFEEHGFDVEDSEGMLAIASKYESDEEVQKAVEEALMECAGELFGALEGLGEEVVDSSETTASAEVVGGPQEEGAEAEVAVEAGADATVGAEVTTE
jgi:hypothetical protein